MVIIRNGQIVTENEILINHDLIIEGNTITGIVPKGVPTDLTDSIIDANGGYITPGFIDIHSDYIEHMAAPRPSSIMDFSLGLHETERELIGHGITTMFHSLSIYKRSLFSEKPIRNPENIKKFADIISNSHSSKHLIRHRFHARFEIDNTERVDELISYIQDGKVHLVSFMDHTPGQGQYRNLELYKHTLKGYKDLSDAELNTIIKETQGSPKLSLSQIKEIAKIAKENNVALASHDDDSVEKIELVKSFDTTISEFPITLEVAQAAKKLGLHTIAGAPNILLGGSHSGNLSAETAILDGSIDILCSDYYPAALIHAIFKMHEKHNLPLYSLLNLVTINPARAVLMDKEIGSIQVGKRADILIIEKLENNFPVVTSAFVDGKKCFTTSYR